MKKFKLIPVLLVSVIIFNSCLTITSGCKKNKKFIPVLRFSIASDVHIEDGKGSILEEERLAKMFNESYAYSKEDKSGYNKLDAVFFVGDFTDKGTTSSMIKFKQIIDDNINDETKLVVSLGNHEFFHEQETIEERFKSVFASNVDEHIVISGFLKRIGRLSIFYLFINNF